MVAVCPECDIPIDAELFASDQFQKRCPHCQAAFSTRAAFTRSFEADPMIRSSELSTMLAPRSKVSRSGSGSFPKDTTMLTRSPRELPGYRIEKLIGQGGMGTVYLGRQISLDRPVAIKVMSLKWAKDPVFVARFTREAHAAARLNHPNVVQIYDIGQTDTLRFFSMEYVEGTSLHSLIQRHGKLAPETAVGYIVQAARGLQHAHDRGVIHRDIKPDNLLINQHSIIKVADLGLVKAPIGMDDEGNYTPCDDEDDLQNSMTMTQVRMALGTPAYMAPEQCRDAANVDHRADIYSLGCTLYALLTGRQPFDGKSAMELMTKHAYEPMPPAETIVPRLSLELSAIVQKMVAKHPGERYASMSEVVRVLEQWLGVTSVESFTPHEDQIERIESLAHKFQTVKTAWLRDRVFAGLLGGGVIFAMLLTFVGQLGWAFGLTGMVVQGGLAYFLFNGLDRSSYLFLRIRAFARRFTLVDWLVGVAGVGLFVVLLWMLGLFWIWLGFGLIGFGLALGIHFGLDRTIDDQRRPILRDVKQLLQSMRGRTIAEEQLRLFVARYSGQHWEEFHEALFGYESKLATRRLLLRGGSAGVRDKFAAWREPIIASIERFEQSRRERQMAQWSSQTDNPLRTAPTPGPSEKSGALSFNLGLSPLRSDATLSNNIALSQPMNLFLQLLLGPFPRLILGSALLAGFALWTLDELLGTTSPLHPKWMEYADPVNIGWGGMLLVISLFYNGCRMSLMVLFGVTITVLSNRLGIQSVEPIRDTHVAMLMGTLFALIGYRWGREDSHPLSMRPF